MHRWQGVLDTSRTGGDEWAHEMTRVHLGFLVALRQPQPSLLVHNKIRLVDQPGPPPKRWVGSRLAIASTAALPGLRPDAGATPGWGTVGEWWHGRSHRVDGWVAEREDVDADDPSDTFESLPLPLAAIVGTATLLGAWPVRDAADPDTSGRYLLVGDRVGMIYDGDGDDTRTIGVLSDLPYGIYEPGRWGWLFATPTRYTHPIPLPEVGRR